MPDSNQKLPETGKTPELRDLSKATGTSAASSAPAKLDLGAGTPAATENSFGLVNIFNQVAPKEKKDSKMVTSVITQKDALQKAKPILGAAPSLEKTMELEKELRMKRKLRHRQILLVLIFAIVAAGSFYFYSELSPSFNALGTNTIGRLANANINLTQTQTSLNSYRYLTAQLNLNELSYQVDSFFSNVAKLSDPTVTAAQKKVIAADVEENAAAMPRLLQDIRTILTQNVFVPIYPIENSGTIDAAQQKLQAEEQLRQALKDERQKLPQNSTNAEDLLNLKIYDNTIKLVGNTALVNQLQQLSLDDFKKKIDDYRAAPDSAKMTALQDTISKVLASTKSDLATVAEIKQRRLNWSSVIQRLDTETSLLDKRCSMPGGDESKGDITYSGYDFDTTNNKIVLSGSTKTTNGCNFTLMSNLIDQLEASPFFQDVEMRSFTKNKGGGSGAAAGYMANFKIDLRLETGHFSDQDKAFSLQLLQKSAPVGVKRTPAPSAQVPSSKSQAPN